MPQIQLVMKRSSKSFFPHCSSNSSEDGFILETLISCLETRGEVDLLLLCKTITAALAFTSWLLMQHFVFRVTRRKSCLISALFCSKKKTIGLAFRERLRKFGLEGVCLLSLFRRAVFVATSVCQIHLC